MSAKPINWRNLLTLVSVAILVGVEFASDRLGGGLGARRSVPVEPDLQPRRRGPLRPLRLGGAVLFRPRCAPGRAHPGLIFSCPEALRRS